MAIWKVTPSWKKSLIEKQYWTREDGPYIVNEMCWRTGEFIIETEGDEPPVIDEDTNLFDLTDHWETSDCCSEEVDYDELDEESEEEVRTFLEENSIYDLEETGKWSLDECEMFMQCEPIIERIE